MPLTTSLRDEDNERINNVLRRLMSVVFVPDNLSQIDFELSQLGLDSEKLNALSSTDLVSHLISQSIDWENLEQFADVLAAFKMHEKAHNIYRYIQSQSKTFSFAIAQKLNVANDQL